MAAYRSQSLLCDHYTRFFVRSLDGPATKRIKMHILLALLRESSALPLLKEFEVEKGSEIPGYTLTILQTDLCARFRGRSGRGCCHGYRSMRPAISTLYPTMYFIVAVSCKRVVWYVPCVSLLLCLTHSIERLCGKHRSTSAQIVCANQLPISR